MNITEKADGFTITGDTGPESGASVTVEVGSESLTATSADVSGTAEWSVSVPAGASYIAGTSVTVTVSASKTGYASPPDVTRTVTVDLEAPTAPDYTVPGSLKVGEPITRMTPSSGVGIDAYGATDLPAGLDIDEGTGAISGTPTAAGAAATATVTVSDAAGNEAEVDITFPAVTKGDQTLSGFGYSASSVRFGQPVPTVTVPPGAKTALTYAATPSTVCTVDASSGALTLVGLGDCAVTATAASTDDWNEASATYTVTVEPAGTLDLNVETIAGDNRVNIVEKASGFAISGDTGSVPGVSVTVEVGSTSLTATSADQSGTAVWSVIVPAAAPYLTATTVTVTVSASKAEFTSPAVVTRTVAVDLEAPAAPDYTAPSSLTVGNAIAPMSPSGGAGVDAYSAAGLPSGLRIDTTTGVISGAPNRAGGAATATVTVSDAAGNSATVDIAFPAVSKGGQTLSGFAYSAPSVRLGNPAPTVTGPTGARTALAYTAAPSTVCTVDALSGALTIVGVGDCVVTATAAVTAAYNAARATYTVTVQPPATTVTLTVSPDTVDEGDSATLMTVTGELAGTPMSAVTTVTVAVGATGDAATEGADYETVNDLTLTIDAGQTSGTATFTLTPIDDNLDEGNETLTLNGSTTSPVSFASSPTVTVRDDERVVHVSRTALEIGEGPDGSATYTVVLGSQPASTVTVRTALWSPPAGANLSVSPSSLSFTPSNWAARQTVTVTAADDEYVEEDAVVELAHAASGGGYDGVTAASVWLTVLGLEEGVDGTVRIKVPEDTASVVTVPEGTSVPTGTQVMLPAGTEMVSIQTVGSDHEALTEPPRGFHAGGTVVDIEPEPPLEAGETAVVCLPANNGEQRVHRWDDEADPPQWVELEPPSSGSRPGLTCGVTDDFSLFALGLSLPANDELPSISIADTSAKEKRGSLDFPVTLSKAVDAFVCYDFETLAAGTATEGVDFSARQRSTRRMEAGQMTDQPSVHIIDDSVDDNGETVKVRISNARLCGNSSRTIDIVTDEATGTINDEAPIPREWLARFGRTVAEQAVDAVESRIRSAPKPGVEVRLAGRRIGPRAGTGAAPQDGEARQAAAAAARLAALSRWLRDGTEAEDGFVSQPVSERDLLTGSSFTVTAAAGGADGGIASLWGRGALTSFDGRAGEEAVSGDVTSVMLGADWTRASFGAGNWAAGLMLSHSRGEGTYGGANEGSLSSSVTGLYPYGRYALSRRVTVWGMVGYGTGTVTRTPEEGEAIKTGLDLNMASAGLRGTVVEAPAGGGPELAVKLDAMAVRTSSDRVMGSLGSVNVAAETADVTRFRLGLEGRWGGLRAGAGTLEPRLGVGLRHDGGDAETGFGLDLDGGLAWSHGESGIGAEVSGHGLLTHQSTGFRMRGIAGSLSWDPAPDSARGPSLTLTQTLGVSARGRVDAVLGRNTLDGLAANDLELVSGVGGNELGRRRLGLKLGYGFAAFDGRFTLTPELGLGVTDSSREVSLGWRLMRERRSGILGSLELSFEGRRREFANGSGSGAGAKPEHSIGFRLTARF